MPLFLQNGLGLSAALTGTIMLPASLIAIVAMPFATKVLTTKGEKALALTGVAIMLVGSSVFLNVDANISLAIVIVFMCIRCFGIALAEVRVCVFDHVCAFAGSVADEQAWALL